MACDEADGAKRLFARSAAVTATDTLPRPAPTPPRDRVHAALRLMTDRVREALLRIQPPLESGQAAAILDAIEAARTEALNMPDRPDAEGPAQPAKLTPSTGETRK